MTNGGPSFWTDDTSVLFTSFWGWAPETWGTVGWTGDAGRTHRDKLLLELTNPFITVVYVTRNQSYIDAELKGMIAGFYLVSHETGDRDNFTHPIHHNRSPKKWRNSLRAIRAFSYLPEYRLSAYKFKPGLREGEARAVAYWGELLSDPAQITTLRDTPWTEVDVYTSGMGESAGDDDLASHGKVRAGPASKGGYVVSQGTEHLPRQLYVFRLGGDTDAFLGQSAEGRSIYKIGLSVSPELRRQAFQKSMPQGAFHWEVDRTSKKAGFASTSFDAAVAGENAMKSHLARCAKWLGGEFYLSTEAEIDEAWQFGLAAAQSPT